MAQRIRYVDASGRSFPPGRAAAWTALFAGATGLAAPQPSRIHTVDAPGRVKPLPAAAVLALLVVLATVLRAIGLGTEVWLDEMYTSILALRPSFLELLTVYNGDNQHPLYSLLGHLSIVLFGESPWSIRLPALVFGVASVPMLYVLGRQVATRREALLAAALLAVSYHHIWFSQNARGYTMLAFFAMLATHLLLRGVRHGRRRDFLGYAVAVALGIFTHLTMVFVVAAHVLICAWLAFITPRERRLDWRLPLLGFTVGGVLTLALYAPIMTQVLAWFLHRP
ncbi:MAG: glycosyltransferase family 39 protein, partial [Longimicrobiales bacterium]